MGDAAYDELVMRCEAHLRTVKAVARARRAQAAAAAGAPGDARRQEAATGAHGR